MDSVTAMAAEIVSAPDPIRSTDTNSDIEDNTQLTLAYERLTEIPTTIIDYFSERLIYLDISHNEIVNLDPLVHFKNLTTLIADANLVTEDSLLPMLPNLQLLWLNHCKIKTLFPWIKKLQHSCPDLQHLCLMGNPAAPSYFNGGTFYEYLQYRLFVISQFPSLVHLDDRSVTEDQRSEAKRLYKRPFFERLLRPGSTGLSGLVSKSIKWKNINDKFGFSNRTTSNRNLLI